MTKALRRYERDPVAFIDDLVKLNELGKPFELLPHQREILKLAFPFDQDGKLPYDTIIWSCPKKSGKTTTNALLTLWWAFTQEPPNEILVCANDLEQAQGRVFKAIAGLLRHNRRLSQSAEIQSKLIRLSNGTTITALASEYAGAAGSNHGLTSWDELWGYSSETSQRLWEELTPVPTRRNSIRLVTTYAGWEGESTLLWELYKAAVGSEEYTEGQGERLHSDFPIFHNPDHRLLCYWDHKGRMPWQTEAYYSNQKRSLRAGSYLRLHENRWATAESAFITPELWDPCVDPDLTPQVTSQSPLFVGVDAGVKRDNSAVVAVRWEGEKLRLVTHRIWKPTPAEPLNLSDTIEEYLRELHRTFRVREILCDPYQLHGTITTLKSAGIPIREFPQTTGNTTRMGQALFDVLNSKTLQLYPSEELRAQALNTVAVENPRGWRIAKEKASRKIDAVVALAMACVSALDHPRVEHMGFPLGVGHTERREDYRWGYLD